MATDIGQRKARCRYLSRFGDQCTAEVANPNGEILLCVHHLALALELIKRGAA